MIIGILFTLQVRDSALKGGTRYERNIQVIASTLNDAIDTYYEKTDHHSVAFERVVDAKLAREEDRPLAGVYIDERRIESVSKYSHSKST